MPTPGRQRLGSARWWFAAALVVGLLGMSGLTHHADSSMAEMTGMTAAVAGSLAHPLGAAAEVVAAEGVAAGGVAAEGVAAGGRASTMLCAFMLAVAGGGFLLRKHRPRPAARRRTGADSKRLWAGLQAELRAGRRRSRGAGPPAILAFSVVRC